ncbi:MAG: hypothetical protein ABR992_20145 [Solirubrobacteraceae bacterium]|jgi:hypothetical protein
MKRAAITTAVAVVLAGCTHTAGVTAPLGRSIAAGPPRPVPVVSTPAPVGDPPAERGGTIPAAASVAEDTATPAGVAKSQQLALRRYALVYVNWRAADLRQRERQLVAMSIGAAKLVAEQTAGAQSGTAALIADGVANSGEVVAIAPGGGPDFGQWVIVTLEHTTGTGPYAGLPTTPHVTFARVRRVKTGWVVSAWTPAS